MRTPLISIIVPVYNSSGFLEKCLDSLINQSFLETEIILIDDGSTDDSLSVCERYSQKDYRIKLLRQKKNIGLSAARNRGIRCATAKFIAFIDSDDWVPKNYFEDLYKTMIEAEADVVICKTVFVYPTVISTDGVAYAAFYDLWSQRLRLLGDGLQMAVWGKLFHRDLIQGRQVFFWERDHEYKGFAEDVAFTFEIFRNCKRVAYCASTHYYYNKENTDSIVEFGRINVEKKERNLEDKRVIIRRLFEKVLQLNFDKSEKKAFLRFWRCHLRWDPVLAPNVSTMIRKGNFGLDGFFFRIRELKKYKKHMANQKKWALKESPSLQQESPPNEIQSTSHS